MLETKKIETKTETDSENNITSRASSPLLEEILYKPIKLLDHGFIRVIDYMGNDSAIVQAARVSYGKGTKKSSEDRGLIHYLMRHSHSTPFEMCEIKLHVKLPIFVARQWIRHRTASVNEYSARYSILNNEFYIPERNLLAPQSNTNKQGRESVLSDEESSRVLDILINDSQNAYLHYQEMLNQDENGNIFDETKSGLTRELARMNLTMNFYTEWYWKINLHNLMHFVRLRADNHAQYEIRVYAEKILDIIKLWVPFAYEAFMDYKYGSTNLSAKAMNVVKAMINGQKPSYEESGMGKREWQEFTKLFDLEG